MPVVEIENLTKRYGSTTAVADVSLSVDEGEIVGVLGPNGAGKTTTVEALVGLRRPSSGTVRLWGTDPFRRRRLVRPHVGVQLQSSRFNGYLSVRELLTLFSSFYPDPRPSEELVEALGLTDVLRTRFDDLSGGQQQRLSIAIALVGRPRLVVLDELTTGLDPHARRRVWSLVEELRGDGVTVILVSHAMDEVEKLCDRVHVLVDGSVRATGSPDAVTREAGEDDMESAYLALTGHRADELEEMV
ncbi:ABC transporter ATP-binding protein [Aeromicrobium sp. CTD01-1L150]|uniref:ABC transporter ATP-binding protein n=1 Tax=Aeromicrobium sp. CTD01-1L150 TaxID=3341830 RepID=UPI0035C08551